MAAMLVAAAPLSALSRYYANAVQSHMQVSQTRLSELRSSTAQAAATAARIDQLRTNVTSLERDVESFESAISARRDLATLLEAVDALAARSNVTVRRFAPQSVREQGAYAEVSYKLQVDGTYLDLSRLFESIGEGTPTVGVRDLTISSKLEQPGEGRLRAECLLSAIILTDDVAAGSHLDVSASESKSEASDGRSAVPAARDPFAMLAEPVTAETTDLRAAGLHGLLVDDISVKGIIRDAAGFRALLQGPDKRTFIARTGEKLFDAVVKTVTGDAIVFARTGDERRRAGGEVDVVRTLRPVAGGRQ